MEWERRSLQMRASFGLRHEESIETPIEWADRGERLVLKETWIKGGRRWDIPTRIEEQRRVPDEATRFAGKVSSLVLGHEREQITAIYIER